MRLITRIVSSLDRVFPNRCPQEGITSAEAFQNEPVSFQIGYRAPEGNGCTFYVKAETELPLSCFRVGYVPVSHIVKEFCDEPLEAGLFPDMLLPIDLSAPVTDYAMFYSHNLYAGKCHMCYASPDRWDALWFTVNEKQGTLIPGTYPVRVSFYSVDDGSPVAEVDFSVTIVPASLPKQSLLYTNWFHCDCLADYYHVPMFSKRFFEIFADYAAAAARHGMNMILLPAFTPPLDTAIGFKRRRAQLVTVMPTGKNTYAFDFSLMKTFIRVAKEAGITAFEHSHLFSQWGATCAPAVYITYSTYSVPKFGWNTPASSPAYRAFLEQYLQALKEFLREEPANIFFHISDEPNRGQLEAYASASDMVRSILGDEVKIMDALSDAEFYERGLLTTPVVVTTSLKNFPPCDDLWAYYTGGQSTEGLSTRVIYAAPARNRAMGCMLYKNRIKGFLHWGYNYWYDRPSVGLFDPKMDACGYAGTGASSFCVYPGEDKHAIASMRQKVFYEGICDMRALEAAEAVLGREVCEKLLEKYFGPCDFYSAKPDQRILRLREELHSLLRAASGI